jgi:succinyl-diaminopimelate desuccinylase
VSAALAQPLDLRADSGVLLARLVDVFSVSGSEGPLADAIETALRELAHLEVLRHGDAVVARTALGHPERVVIAGHIDTVPLADNLPARVEGGVLWGLGSTDMKAGIAVMLRLAAALPTPSRDVTYVFYDHEEVESVRNGLGRLSRDHADWLAGDFAVLMEPTDAIVEAGCQGTLRAEVTVRGRRAHSARSWMGVNAIHGAAEVLDRLVAYEPRRVLVDGLEYREGLNAVGVRGGVAGNVIPDSCAVSVNYRFAPDRSLEEAEEHVRAVFTGYELELMDGAAGAVPGLARPAAAEFVAAIGAPPKPKVAWTDVARFSALGVPAVNYGPGDPQLAHTSDERVQLARLVECEDRLRRWLAGRPPSAGS